MYAEDLHTYYLTACKFLGILIMDSNNANNTKFLQYALITMKTNSHYYFEYSNHIRMRRRSIECQYYSTG